MPIGISVSLVDDGVPLPVSRQKTSMEPSSSHSGILICVALGCFANVPRMLERLLKMLHRHPFRFCVKEKHGRGRVGQGFDALERG
jgi:hypothetical protein